MTVKLTSKWEFSCVHFQPQSRNTGVTDGHYFTQVYMASRDSNCYAVRHLPTEPSPESTNLILNICIATIVGFPPVLCFSALPCPLLVPQYFSTLVTYLLVLTVLWDKSLESFLTCFFCSYITFNLWMNISHPPYLQNLCLLRLPVMVNEIETSQPYLRSSRKSNYNREKCLLEAISHGSSQDWEIMIAACKKL